MPASKKAGDYASTTQDRRAAEAEAHGRGSPCRSSSIIKSALDSRVRVCSTPHFSRRHRQLRDAVDTRAARGPGNELPSRVKRDGGRCGQCVVVRRGENGAVKPDAGLHADKGSCLRRAKRALDEKDWEAGGGICPGYELSVHSGGDASGFDISPFAESNALVSTGAVVIGKRNGPAGTRHDSECRSRKDEDKWVDERRKANVE